MIELKSNQQVLSNDSSNTSSMAFPYIDGYAMQAPKVLF